MNRFQRASQVWPLLTVAARVRQVPSYRWVSKAIGVPLRGLGQVLEPIQSYCILNSLPALTSLVVSEKTGLPGDGFIAAENVPREQARVFAHDWLTTRSPTDADLQTATQRLPTNGRPLAEILESLDRIG